MQLSNFGEHWRSLF